MNLKNPPQEQTRLRFLSLVFVSLCSLLLAELILVPTNTISANTSNFSPSWEQKYYTMELSKGPSLGPLLGEISFWDLSKLSREQLGVQTLSVVPSKMRKNFQKILPEALSLSAKHQIDPIWVLSIMWVESQYRLKAVSPMGALGPMQIMPSTGSFLLAQAKQGLASQKIKGERTQKQKKQFQYYSTPYRRDLIRDSSVQRRMQLASSGLLERIHQQKNHNFDLSNNTSVNIELGIIYLKYLLETFECPTLATIAYNMGPNWVKTRLHQNIPVGTNNAYLQKVQTVYKSFSLQLL
ncbi:MAG: transglycosylase SLT domain-containing protein [Oligoflexia bacterium]|nr:transglycosylase SLT domain-containing protein [Oligoflexia bacterium]MBF0365461.1 transglycosylase SLT domain-containing protein [Oligoflexia bacterium]